jgi:hypothetical protein
MEVPSARRVARSECAPSMRAVRDQSRPPLKGEENELGKMGRGSGQVPFLLAEPPR